MTATFIERPTAYIRRSDGRRVVAADWPDGSVSWRLDPIPPVLLSGSAVGTCSAAIFEASHTPLPQEETP